MYQAANGTIGMHILAVISFMFLSLRLFIAVVNVLTRPRNLAASLTGKKPMISILIPARNEEHNLPALLKSLIKLTYRDYEVIVCNDHSTDNTPEILEKFVQTEKNFQWFTSEKLPASWLGKNFACHQLARKAKGDYLLFLDADIHVQSGFLSPIINRVIHKNLSLLSLFPRQIMYSTGEKSTVPLMNWILISLLPLPLVRLSKQSSLTAANGQFMLFEAKNYGENQWHQQVKHENVEDILLMRKMKKAGFRVEVLANFGAVSCRMYSSYREAVEGFSRNIHQYFGSYSALMILFWLLTIPGILIGLLLLPVATTLVLICQAILLRIIISLHSRQPVWANLYYHPLQMAALTHILVRNLLGKRKKTVRWKEREIPFG